MTVHEAMDYGRYYIVLLMVGIGELNVDASTVVFELWGPIYIVI